MASGVSAKQEKQPPAGPAAPPGAVTDPSAPAPSAPPQPLTPRPVLFKVMCAVFAAWIGFLVFLYLKTGSPRRSTAPDPDVTGMIRPDAAPAQGP